MIGVGFSIFRPGSPVRAEIEAAARKALIDEQRGKLDALGRSGAVPADVLAQVIKAAYDL